MTARPRGAWPSLAARRAVSDRLYAENPERFTGAPTRFSLWALERISRLGGRQRILELGCGPGRDSRALAAAGHTVRAVDHSRVAIERARSAEGNPPTLRFESQDALQAVRRSPSASFDVVYAHGLYMMLSDREMEELLTGIRRVLRRGGLHLFAVRSVTDPHAARGKEIAPDVRVGGPHATPHRYYRARSLDAMAEHGFALVEAEFVPDLHLFYVCHRKP